MRRIFHGCVYLAGYFIDRIFCTLGEHDWVYSIEERECKSDWETFKANIDFRTCKVCQEKQNYIGKYWEFYGF